MGLPLGMRVMITDLVVHNVFFLLCIYQPENLVLDNVLCIDEYRMVFDNGLLES